MSLKVKVKVKVTDHVEFVADHMEFGVVENLNSWMCLKGGKMQKNLDCVFAVKVKVTLDNIAHIQGYVG